MQVTGTATAAVANQGAATSQPRLVRAAHEFEAQLMKELLKPMTASDGLAGDEDDSGAGAGGVLGEFASEALGRALSEQGGLGIASSIVRDLSHAGNHGQSSKVTRNLHGNTEIRKHE
jgi:Rod binding domain-containing protein